MQRTGGVTRPSQSLMMGTGRVTKHWDTDKIELHLNPADYTSLVTSRTKDVFTVAEPEPLGQQSPTNSPRSSEVTLPKTYVTRAGSLFIYSDSKIMKDNQQHFPKFKTLKLDVKGRGVTMPSSHQHWISQVAPKTHTDASAPKLSSVRKKENKSYLKSCQESEKPKIPYSWNYAVTPVKIIDPENEADVRTVKGLSEAALSYKQGSRASLEEEHYLDLIRTTWGNRREMERKKAMKTNQHFSKWTQDWINSHRELMNSPLPRSLLSPRLPRTKTSSRLKTVSFGTVNPVRPSGGPTNTPMPDKDRPGIPPLQTQRANVRPYSSVTKGSTGNYHF